MRKLLLSVFLVVVALTAGAQLPRSADFHSRYRLTGAVALSRHNIRSPLSGNGSALSRITSHEWFKWTSAPSELSLRGGELETLMGQYFRQWFDSEGLLPADAEAATAVRFYANSMQRTIATAQYFSSGFLPTANVRIEHRFAPSRMDSVFNPCLTFVSDAFKAEALSQISAMGGERGLEGIGDDLRRDYRLLERVLDLRHAPACIQGDTCAFSNDLEIVFRQGEEPAMRGSLRLANQASDALILQYYEEPSARRAAFGRRLSAAQWGQVARVKDVYGDVLFTAPVVAVNVAHPLLGELRKELTAGRKFSFLCGHDSNLASVLAALRAKPYSLPQTIEKKTPIGAKLVIERWRGANADFAALNLVYQSTTQLRERTPLTLSCPPVVFPVQLEGLEPNADGLYRLDDLLRRIDEAFLAYDEMRTSLR